MGVITTGCVGVSVGVSGGGKVKVGVNVEKRVGVKDGGRDSVGEGVEEGSVAVGVLVRMTRGVALLVGLKGTDGVGELVGVSTDG